MNEEIKSNISENQKPDNSKKAPFEITVNSQGVFLHVPPSQDRSLIKVNDVVDRLEQQDVQQYDRMAIEKALQDFSGDRIQIAPPKTIEPDIQIFVSKDRMEAELTITRPEGCRPVEAQEILQLLNSRGISFGINEDAVEQAVNASGLRVICASGKKPVDGINASINKMYEDGEKGRPVEMEDGRVDHKNLNIYVLVAQDDILAEKIPATEGEPGMDVLGQEIPSKHGKDVLFPKGKNVNISGDKLIAAIPGQVVEQSGKIHVIPVIEVKGDVDFSTGNINFVGNVIVKGTVQNGFEIKAEGDVEIQGNVSGAIVEGRNVSIRMGIQGMNKGYIKAKGSVTTQYIENGTIYVGDSVNVTGAILNSQVFAGKRISVIGKKALISGGKLVAGEEIHARTIGSPVAVTTDLSVGVNPQLREEYKEVSKTLLSTQHTLDQTIKALTILRAMDQSTMPSDKREMLLKLTKAQFHLTGQVDAMSKRIEEIETMLENMKFGRIRVEDTIYPGAKIAIGNATKLVREVIQFVTFIAEEGEVKSNPYK